MVSERLILGRFSYDETSKSCLRYAEDVYRGFKKARLSSSAGSEAGTIGNHGYYVVSVDYKVHLVHRLIWEHFNGGIGNGYYVDHIDRNRTNNKLNNLRLIPASLSPRNLGLRKMNNTGVTGVTFYSFQGREMYRVTWKDGKTTKFRSFSIKKYGEEEALRLACETRDKMFKEQLEKGEWYDPTHGT